MVTPTYGTGSPPSFAGGPITAGTYYLTAVTAYGDCGQPNGMTAQATYEFSGGASGTAQVLFVEGGHSVTWSATYMTSGSTFTATDTCGGTSTASTLYTATSSSITTDGLNMAPDGGICTTVSTLTLQ